MSRSLDQSVFKKIFYAEFLNWMGVASLQPFLEIFGLQCTVRSLYQTISYFPIEAGVRDTKVLGQSFDLQICIFEDAISENGHLHQLVACPAVTKFTVVKSAILD